VLDGSKWSVSSPSYLPLGKEHPVLIEWEAGCAPEPVLMQWQKQKFPALVTEP